MMKHIKSVFALVSIVAVMGLLLAVTNSITAPIIEANKLAASNAALQAALPDSAGFEEISLSDYELPETVTAVYKETSGKGYVVQLQTSGNYAEFTITCGIDPDGKLVTTSYTETNATYDNAKDYYKNFIGKDMAGVEAVDTIAGTTNATTAYKQAMKDALNTVTIVAGGSVDLRTEEEILADNLKATLPTGDIFTKWFATEEITGVDAIYVADNGAGYVALAVAEEIGEDFTGEFIGIDADLNIVTAGSTANTEAAFKAVKTLKASTLTEVDIADKGLNENIQAVQKTASGNYVIEINGLGFGYFGDSHIYQPAKHIPIVIKVSLTAEGKIIDCLTVSHEESEGYGDKCANEAYYGQFDGKTAETYTEVEAIAGATKTTNGYMKAIERCFEAVTILEGGAQ